MTNPTIESFVSLDKFTVKGRGVAYVVECPYHVDDRDNAPWIGKDVLIDGEKHRCIGVESQCLGHIRKGAKISLLVETVMNNNPKDAIDRISERLRYLNENIKAGSEKDLQTIRQFIEAHSKPPVSGSDALDVQQALQELNRKTRGKLYPSENSNQKPNIESLGAWVFFHEKTIRTALEGMLWRQELKKEEILEHAILDEKIIGDAIVRQAWALEGLPTSPLIMHSDLLGRAALEAIFPKPTPPTNGGE